MTRYTRVRLEPGGPFHFGGRGIGLERSDVWLPADSLFSALCTVLALQKGADTTSTLLKQFENAQTKEAVPFRLTSLMPYAAQVFLLPNPMIGPPLVPGASDLRKRKQFKAIEWVSESVFRRLARHETPTEAMDGDEPVTLHGGKVWLTAQEKQALEGFVARNPETNEKEGPVLWRKHTRPRVTVDRQTTASAIYAVGSTHFNRSGQDRAGLYTVIEWLAAGEAMRKQIMGAFAELGEVGIGGRRSNGFGLFKPEHDSLAELLLGAPAGNYFTTLAPYHPRQSEQAVIGPGAQYEITLRRGWLSLPGFQNVRRSSLRMLADGSVLRRPQAAEPLGDLVNVTPEKVAQAGGPTIYRYGLAFPVRIADSAMPVSTSTTDGGSHGGAP